MGPRSSLEQIANGNPGTRYLPPLVELGMASPVLQDRGADDAPGRDGDERRGAGAPGRCAGGAVMAGPVLGRGVALDRRSRGLAVVSSRPGLPAGSAERPGRGIPPHGSGHDRVNLDPATRPDRPADLGLERFTIESSTRQGRCEDHSGKAVNPPSACPADLTIQRFSLLPQAPKPTRTIAEAGDHTDETKGEGRWLRHGRHGHWSQNNLHSLRTRSGYEKPHTEICRSTGHDAGRPIKCHIRRHREGRNESWTIREDTAIPTRFAKRGAGWCIHQIGVKRGKCTAGGVCDAAEGSADEVVSGAIKSEKEIDRGCGCIIGVELDGIVSRGCCRDREVRHRSTWSAGADARNPRGCVPGEQNGECRNQTSHADRSSIIIELL
jgi:hypothetical protein